MGRHHFEEVQAHYDLSDDFFRLFLDPTMTYSCAYFDRRRDITLEEAQLAKMDLSLAKLGLRSGMTLLDVGCGWGGTMRRAIEKYDVNVIGLTLSKNQAAHVQKAFDAPVDRIVSLGACDHFGYDRYDDFFGKAYSILPDDGVMLLHTITMLTGPQIVERGLPLSEEQTSFNEFIATEIFPGGQLPAIEMVEFHSAKMGFNLTRRQSLQLHYARTLDHWAAALEAHKAEAIKMSTAVEN